MALRLGTFNVWGLPEAFGDDVSSRMRGLAARLPGLGLDLLLIQEAWTEEVRDTLREAALGAEFEVADGVGSNGGLMVLSRMPIRTSRFESFRFRGDPERLAQGEFLGGKGFQSLEVDGPHGRLSVFNTHLHARYRRSQPQLNSAVRTAQLLQIIGSMSGFDGATIVGGDFNCRHGDVEYQIFRRLTRATELANGRGYSTLSNLNFYKRGRRNPDKRIDYLFVRPPSEMTLTPSDPGLLFSESVEIRARQRSFSDHYGFRAAFELEARSTRGGSSAFTNPDRDVFDAARVLLNVGREEADRRERAHFRSAGSWAMGAALAAGIRRHPALDRRRFLQSAAGILSVLAVTPAIGYGTLARIDSDYKRDAFDDAHSILAQLEARPNETA